MITFGRTRPTWPAAAVAGRGPPCAEPSIAAPFRVTLAAVNGPNPLRRLHAELLYARHGVRVLARPLLLFVVVNITREPMSRIVRDLWPFILALVAALIFITFVPDFVLFIPRLLGYRG